MTQTSTLAGLPAEKHELKRTDRLGPEVMEALMITQTGWRVALITGDHNDPDVHVHRGTCVEHVDVTPDMGKWAAAFSERLKEKGWTTPLFTLDDDCCARGGQQIAGCQCLWLPEERMDKWLANRQGRGW